MARVQVKGQSSAPKKTSFGLGSVFTPLAALVGILVALHFQTDILDSYLVPTGLSRLSFLDKTVDVFDAANNITYRGRGKGPVEYFQNVFYAEDTSGKNRFAPPKPYVAPQGSIIDATAPGAWCSQGLGPTLPFASVVTNVSENCLSLWIARPRGAKKSAKLPVAVYMHGGGHGFGSTYEIMYTPDGLIDQSSQQGEPIIYVGINYRVGIFGFAYTDALQADGHTNVGLRDQRAAFEWVQTHIATFGGDPGRVTAIGNSAGSSDIGIHLTSFGGDKGVPFHRAIMIGAAPNSMFNLARDDAKERTTLAAKKIGCAEDPNTDSAAMTKCLRDTPWEKMMNVSVDLMRTKRPPFGEQYFAPKLDGDIVLDLPSKAMREGKFNKGIPLIASWNRNDASWLPPATLTTDNEVVDSIAIFISGMSQETRAKILEHYPLSDFEHRAAPGGRPPTAQYFRAVQINRDFWFACPTLDFTCQYARHSGLESIRLYENNQSRFAPVFESMGVPFWGISHLSDVVNLFNVQDLPGGIDSSPAQLAFAKEMSSEIVAFVNGGTAAAGGSPNFPEYWTPAYASNDAEALRSEYPREINVKVYGGSEGSGMASVSAAPEGTPKGPRDAWVAEEKLFARCEFINSAKVRGEMGV